MVNPHKILGQRIRNERKQRNMTLAELADTVEATISTISKIERSEGGYKASDEMLERIAKAFGTTLENLKSGSGNYRIGFGACLWAAPLLHMMDLFDPSLKINLCYLKNEDDTFVWQNDVPQENYTILTARELIEELKSRELDLIFIPAAAYNSLENIFTRVCRITHTVEGGLYILTYPTGANNSQNPSLDFLSGNGKVILHYAKDTIAESATDLIKGQPNIKVKTIEINHLGSFKENFVEEAIAKNSESADYISYIGWQPHISNLYDYILTQIKEGNIKNHRPIIEPFNQIVHRHNDGAEPYTVTFDGFIVKDQEEIFRNNNDVKEFFFELNKMILEINKFKKETVVQEYHEKIAEKLFMDPQETLAELKKTSYELSFSIEALFKR